ncbi:hypothetical protein SKAU_G00148490 [Synaphobranchus kaupii]|uniref:Uncharacterized protein n=1 Tax=Synaphobranchus kaupii TaxID=118154 RepID=A0A9Q1J500_SYNKA|nr:hypothetical protein SKAU_G00148490 [Synaphobranchus kaupii]
MDTPQNNLRYMTPGLERYAKSAGTENGYPPVTFDPGGEASSGPTPASPKMWDGTQWWDGRGVKEGHHLHARREKITCCSLYYTFLNVHTSECHKLGTTDRARC